MKKIRGVGRICHVWALLCFSSISMAQQPADTQATRIAKRPELIVGPQPFPAEAKVAGHNGTVLVSVILTEVGLIENPSIKQSSGSGILDRAALRAVQDWKLTPALDSYGTAVRAPITLNLEYTQAFDKKYKCRQFVIDSDWFDQVKGKSHRDELRIYKTLRGLPLTAAISNGNAASIRGYDFDIRWDRLIDFCRNNLDKSFREGWRELL